MKKSTVLGLSSGCLVSLLVFTISITCLCPLAAMVGSISSTLLGDSVARIMTPILCPAGSTGEIITFATTILDGYNNTTPSTGYEMQCVDAAGMVVRDPNPDYAFYWIGILAAGSLILSIVLGLVLAAPVGVFIARIRKKNNNHPNLVEIKD
jgi:hypothetical protein